MKKILQSNTLFSSILFLLFGVILFTNPGNVFDFISYIAGGILFLIGIFNILSYYKTLKKLNIEQTSKLIFGISLIVLALIVIFLSNFIETTIRLICAGWIIYSGITKLIQAINVKDKVTFYVTLSISILMILCGFYVALNAHLILSLIGLFIMIYSILEIASYVFSKKKKAK